jgi:hypothetical protein
MKRLFSFGLVPENLTRGPRGIKVEKYELNPKYNKSHLLVTSLLINAFKVRFKSLSYYRHLAASPSFGGQLAEAWRTAGASYLPSKQ